MNNLNNHRRSSITENERKSLINRVKVQYKITNPTSSDKKTALNSLKASKYFLDLKYENLAHISTNIYQLDMRIGDETQLIENVYDNIIDSIFNDGIVIESLVFLLTNIITICKNRSYLQCNIKGSTQTFKKLLRDLEFMQSMPRKTKEVIEDQEEKDLADLSGTQFVENVNNESNNNNDGEAQICTDNEASISYNTMTI